MNGLVVAMVLISTRDDDEYNDAYSMTKMEDDDVPIVAVAAGEKLV